MYSFEEICVEVSLQNKWLYCRFAMILYTKMLAVIVHVVWVADSLSKINCSKGYAELEIHHIN